MNRLSGKRTIQQRLGWILFLLTVISLPTASLAQSESDSSTFKSFKDWCLNRHQLLPQVRRTVDVLLQQVGTSNCDRANQQLSEQESLDLSTLLLSDLSPLTGLAHLTELKINNNQITDITPLQSLTNLQQLDLSHNKIVDIRPLQSLTQLTRLNLSYNQISDISPLQSLNNLIEIYLISNKVVDITALKSLNKIRFLFMEENPLTSHECPISPKYICRFD